MIDAPWRIEMLGWLRAIKGDQVVSRFRTRKTGALLAYLVFYRHRSHSREVLIELLWPDGSPEAGRQSLRKALSSLRLQLEPPDMPAGSVIWADRATVQFNPTAVITDVGQFEAVLEAAARGGSEAERRERLAEAADRSGGELLPGYFEEWALQERQRLAEVYLRGLEQLVAGLEQAGELHEALRWARRAVIADPLREEGHQTLIRLLNAAGQAEGALGQYRELERLLAQELGVVPSDESRALAAELERGKQPASAHSPRKGVPRPSVGAVRQTSQAAQGQEARSAADAAGSNPGRAPPTLQPTAAGSPPGGRLPLQFTRFFGREAEIARLGEMLQDNDTRLVTLTGPGGSGKTRLASEVARRMRAAFDGAVWFVPLADLSEPALIVDKALDALGLSRSPEGGLLEQLMTALSSLPTLLLLDNFEQLVEGGAELVQTLLERVETLTVLVTSRRRLDLAAEREFPVPPLPVPVESLKLRVESPTKSGRSDLSTLNSQLPTLTQFPSVALFVDRAQAVRPDFQVTAGNAAAIAGLCARLEGLPLALELAAARIQVLTPAQMLVRLEGRFELLVGRRRDTASRHRSLWAALDWSYQLLAPELQRFFAQLSVFRGGWTLEAAEAVCEEPRGLDFLEELRGCSLVLSETPDTRRQTPAQPAGADGSTDNPRVTAGDCKAEVRFRLLETLREFGAEHMAPAVREALVRRHAAYYTALAEQAEAEWAGPAQEEWLERLELEHDNLRAVLTWSEESGEAETGLRVGAALGWFWHTRDYRIEGRERLERLLALPGAQGRTAVRAKALACAGLCAGWQGDMTRAQALSEESLTIGRELGDRLSIAVSLRNLGDVARRRGDLNAARDSYQEGLALWRDLGNRWGVAMSLDMLSYIARAAGDYGAARSLSEEQLAIRRELGDKQGISAALDSLGDLARLQAEFSTARSLLEEGLAIRRDLGIKLGIAFSLTSLGLLARDEGNDTEARALFEEVLAIHRELGIRSSIASALLGLGRVAQAQGDVKGAQAFLEESLAMGRQTDNKSHIAASLHHLGGVAEQQGNFGRAAVLYGESLSIARDSGDKPGIVGCLEALAGVAWAEEHRERAARLFAAARAMRDGLGAAPPHDPDRLRGVHRLLFHPRPEREEQLAALRAALGEAAFTAAWEAGRALTGVQAVAEALEELDIVS